MLLSNPKLTITFISHQKKFFAFTDFFISQIPVVSNRSPALPNWVCWTKALHTMRITTKFSKTLRWSGAVGKKVGGVGCQFFSAWMGWKKIKSPLPSSWVLGVSSPGFQERWVFVGKVQFLVKISQRSCRIINIQRLYQSHFLQKDVHKTHMWKKHSPKLSDISRYEGYGYGEIDLLYRTKMMFNSTNSYSRIFNHSTWPLYKTSQGRLVVMTYLLPVSGKKIQTDQLLHFFHHSPPLREPKHPMSQAFKDWDLLTQRRMFIPILQIPRLGSIPNLKF